VRAKALLLAADGLANTAIAAGGVGVAGAVAIGADGLSPMGWRGWVRFARSWAQTVDPAETIDSDR